MNTDFENRILLGLNGIHLFNLSQTYNFSIIQWPNNNLIPKIFNFNSHNLNALINNINLAKNFMITKPAITNREILNEQPVNNISLNNNSVNNDSILNISVVWKNPQTIKSADCYIQT